MSLVGIGSKWAFSVHWLIEVSAFILLGSQKQGRGCGIFADTHLPAEISLAISSLEVSRPSASSPE